MFFCGLECAGHSFAHVAHFAYLRDVCFRTQRAAVASRCATNLATFSLNLATHLPQLSHPSPKRVYLLIDNLYRIISIVPVTISGPTNFLRVSD
jgi:hypothetical protein